MAVCTVCSNRPARALIDGAIAAGSTPINAWRDHGEALGLGLHSVYRHVRHRHGQRSALTPTWLGEATTGDLLADLAALRTSHIEQRDRAIERNDHATAAREGTAAQTALSTLLRLGITDDTDTAYARGYDRLARSLSRASHRDPNIARAVAQAARELKLDDLAREADELAVVAEQHRIN